MPRITMTFLLHDPDVRPHLLRELALHDDVVAHALDSEAGCGVVIETDDLPGAAWEVRSTVGLFDVRATEVGGQRWRP